MPEPSDFDKLGFKVTLHTSRGEEPYEIALGNLSAQDEFDFHEATGKDFMQALDSMSTYVIAAFVWLERRRCGEKRLQFAEVAREVKLRDLESMKPLFDEDTDDEEPQVEANLNGARPERSGEPSAETFQDSVASTG